MTRLSDWSDVGVILHCVDYSDSKCIVTLITKEHGVVKGMVSVNRRNKAAVQPLVIAEIVKGGQGLGYIRIESFKLPLDYPCNNQGVILASLSISSLIYCLVPEGECSCDSIFVMVYDFASHIANCTNIQWMYEYISIELELLKFSGCILDISECVVSGAKEDLKYLSPRSGRSVTSAIGLPYADKLFEIPQLMHCISQGCSVESIGTQEFVKSLKILGYFLHKSVFHPLHLDEPAYRYMFTDYFKALA